MAYLEAAHKWTLTSTGTGKFQPLGMCQSVTFGILPSESCTATVQILHRMGSTSEAGEPSVLSTTACATTNTMVTEQFLGPLQYVAPRVVDKTAGGATNTVTVWVQTV